MRIDEYHQMSLELIFQMVDLLNINKIIMI